VSLSLDRDLTGLVGESGSGKSTLAYAIMRLLPRAAHVAGKILFDGIDILSLSPSQMRDIRGKKIAMVFQGSMNSLDPLMRVEDQVAEAIMIHENENRGPATRKARDVLGQLGLPAEKAQSYPHELSGGLKQRVSIASALTLTPDLLIADEPTTALDVMTQAQIMQTIREIKETYGMSVVLISHDIALVSEVSEIMAVMYAGKIVETGPVAEIVGSPAHPYTVGLMASVPSVDAVGVEGSSIGGDPPDQINPIGGCRFRPRCPYAQASCETFDSRLREVGPRHSAACVLVGGEKQWMKQSFTQKPY
jgi:peptide/nickel transport system ATP-binding protein